MAWCPKYRKEVLTGAVADDLKRIIREIAQERDVEIVQMVVRPDSVELLVDVSPLYGIGEFVRHVKWRSSSYLRSTYAHLRSLLPTLWTQSYFVATISTADANAVTTYIENQPRRSRK